MSDRQSILIELYWHNERLHTFVVQPGKSEPQVFSTSLSSQRLHEYVTSFQMAFFRNDSDERESGAWTELADSWLGEGLGDLITKDGRIVLVPHGLFHHLPLHLLPFQGKPLVMTCPVSYCPSATLFVECREHNRQLLKEREKFQLLVIGSAFEDEARMVHATVENSSLWLQSETPLDKDRLLSRLSEFQWVHFSCHGIFDIEEPMQSGLVLSMNGKSNLSLTELRQNPANYLTAAEISGSRINSALVTLSACETAQTKSLPGDEILGLTRAFFLAGAGAVMVSFWPVPAGPTLDFMQSFYQQLLAQPISLSDAVQAAYLSTAKLHPDPFDWGAFALVGEGISSWKLN